MGRKEQTSKAVAITGALKKITFSLSDENPSCSHGRMLRVTRSQTISAPHYVCSAFSRKSDCVSDSQKMLGKKWPVKRLKRVKPEQRCYCVTCDSLFISSDKESSLHNDHRTRIGITDRLLKMPSFLLSPLSDAGAHAVSYLVYTERVSLFHSSTSSH